MRPLRTILHPTDFSDTAHYAYHLAVLIARECGSRLIVLHVAGMSAEVVPMIYAEAGAPYILPGDSKAYHKALRCLLHDKFETDPEMIVETRLTEGDPAQEILRAAQETGCDLIVMGTHGRSGLDRLLMGSVAEAVLRKADCPVLTVKAPANALPAEAIEPAREAVMV